MSCKSTQQQLENYFDDELTLSEKRTMEKHLEDCTSCASLLQGLHSTRRSLLQLESHDASTSLKRRLHQQLRHSDNKPARRVWPWIGLGSAVTVALFIGVWLTFGLIPYYPATITDEDMINAHVRSLMADHVMDIVSNDQHTVKPWFKGKLDFAPPVRQLEEHGFPLLGGRLDYVRQQSVAALVYQRRAHIINLFVGLADKNNGNLDVSRRGYNLLSWYDRGLQFWLVSDLNKSELNALAQLLRQGKTSLPNARTSG